MNLRPDHFVRVSDIDPGIRIALRYCSDENFMGRQVPGYIRPIAYLTEKTAILLSKAQKKFNEQGYDIVIYDTYRPLKACQAFKQWSMDPQDQQRKADYYPGVNKADLFDLGFIASKSRHCCGIAVDMTIIEKDKSLFQNVVKQERKFADGTQVIYLDDNTLDMGIHFDFFGEVSFTQDKTISEAAQKNRQFLVEVMSSCGFENYRKEWWHFQIDTQHLDYYDFDVA